MRWGGMELMGEMWKAEGAEARAGGGGKERGWASWSEAGGRRDVCGR